MLKAIESNPSPRQIVDGIETPHSYLARVSSAFGRCSASIIDEEWIVTAEHCVSNDDSTRINNHISIATRVQIEFEACGDKHNSTKVVAHPNYELDLALVKFDPANFCEEASIILPYKHHALNNSILEHHNYQRFEVCGYASGIVPFCTNILKEDFEPFSENNPDRYYFSPSKLERGDSGGPLIYYHSERSYLIGINSARNFVNDVPVRSIVHRIDAYWVAKIIAENSGTEDVDDIRQLTQKYDNLIFTLNDNILNLQRANNMQGALIRDLQNALDSQGIDILNQGVSIEELKNRKIPTIEEKPLCSDIFRNFEAIVTYYANQYGQLDYNYGKARYANAMFREMGVCR